MNGTELRQSKTERARQKWSQHFVSMCVRRTVRSVIYWGCTKIAIRSTLSFSLSLPISMCVSEHTGFKKQNSDIVPAKQKSLL